MLMLGSRSKSCENEVKNPKKQEEEKTRDRQVRQGRDGKGEGGGGRALSVWCRVCRCGDVGPLRRRCRLQDRRRG